VVTAENLRANAGGRAFEAFGGVNLASRSLDLILSIANRTSDQSAGTETYSVTDVIEITGPWTSPAVRSPPQQRAGKPSLPTDTQPRVIDAEAPDRG